MELRHGITDDLVDMVLDRLSKHRIYASLVHGLGRDGVKNRLDKMNWVVGFYLNDQCIAGMWGNGEIHLVTRLGYENRWINKKIFRQFWDWFFSREDKAVVTPDNGLVIPFLLRMGFQWNNNKLILDRKHLKMAA